MSSFTMQLLVPLLVLLATRLFRSRDVLAWSFTTFMWDLDLLYFPLHRALLHNLFLPATTAFLAWRLWQRHVASAPHLAPAGPWEKWRAYYAVPWAVPLVLTTFYHVAHVIQDVFLGGVTLFWPVVNTYFALDLNLYINTQTFEPIPETAAESAGGVPTISHEYLLIFTEDVSTWLIVTLGLGLVLLKNHVFAGTLMPDPDLTPLPVRPELPSGGHLPAAVHLEPDARARGRTRRSRT